MIERLSDLQNIAKILVLKFGDSTNAWVIKASDFSGAFDIYKDFMPSLNLWSEPKSCSPNAAPASVSTVSLLGSCYNEVKKIISRGKQGSQPTTTISTLRCSTSKRGVHFVLHGTPRRWYDNTRVQIRDEKEKLKRKNC